jgi:hypothetical protein
VGRVIRRGPLEVTALHTELVALGVGHRDPARTVGLTAITDHRGPQAEQPLHLVVAPDALWLKIEMKPVLHGLSLRHGAPNRR